MRRIQRNFDSSRIFMEQNAQKAQNKKNNSQAKNNLYLLPVTSTTGSTLDFSIDKSDKNIRTGHILFDEGFVDFAGTSAISMTDEYNNNASSEEITVDINEVILRNIEHSSEENAELRRELHSSMDKMREENTQLRLEIKDDMRTTLQEIKTLSAEQNRKLDNIHDKLEDKFEKLQTSTKNEYKSLRRWIIGIVVPAVLAVVALVYMTWQIIIAMLPLIHR